MMARDPSGDWAKPFRIETDPAICTVQKITDAFNLWLASWAFDQSQGMPWLQQILGQKNPNLNAIVDIMRRALLSLPRVVAVLSLSLVPVGLARNLFVAWSVQIDTGAIVSGGSGVPFTPALAA